MAAGLDNPQQYFKFEGYLTSPKFICMFAGGKLKRIQTKKFLIEKPSVVLGLNPLKFSCRWFSLLWFFETLKFGTQKKEGLGDYKIVT